MEHFQDEVSSASLHESSLTPEEERKLRRRILNRECARSLRQRRLQYVQTLEQKVSDLEQKNQMLQMKIKLLEMNSPLSSSPPASVMSPGSLRSSAGCEVLQAIPLLPEQVKNAPVLAFEVDASEYCAGIPPMFQLDLSHATSAISSPNSTTDHSSEDATEHLSMDSLPSYLANPVADVFSFDPAINDALCLSDSQLMFGNPSDIC
jgi:hypothetical protein